MFTISGDLLQKLAIILPIVAATLVIFIILVNLIIKCRQQFSVKVNCWFCNESTKVPYENRNAFNCPNCSQYNGFDESGGYNKDIPEQHDELLNVCTPQMFKINRKSSLNGLCRLCNNNQRLKVYQLASFIPLNEENYDAEVDHFGKQLEKAYKLCPECDFKVKQTLITQQKWILGMKIHQLKQQGLQTLRNLEKSSKSIQQKIAGLCESICPSFVIVVVISLASLILFNALYSTGIFEKSALDLFLPFYTSFKVYFVQIIDGFYAIPSYLQYLKTESDCKLHDFIDFIHEYLKNTTETSNFSGINSEELGNFLLKQSNINHFTLCLCGFIVQVITSLFTKRKKLKYGPLLFWSFLVVLSWNNYDNALFLLTAQVLAILLTIYTLLTEKSSIDCKIEPKLNTIWNNQSALQSLLLQAQANEIALNATSLQSKSSHQKEDSIDSDCSFESSVSKFTTLNACLPPKTATNNAPVFRNVLTPPIVFKPKPVAIQKSKSSQQICGIDNYLNRSMNNLCIGSENIRPAANIFKPIKVNHLVNRPLISPPRLKFDNLNGSHWNPNLFNYGLSRSSSQSSGFASQVPFTTSSPNNSICSDFDYASLFSEPLTQKTKFSDCGISEFNCKLSNQFNEPL
nr:uncharacterized protein LOC111414874 isoform X1 [Onthophagus taurus]